MAIEVWSQKPSKYFRFSLLSCYHVGNSVVCMEWDDWEGPSGEWYTTTQELLYDLKDCTHH